MTCFFTRIDYAITLAFRASVLILALVAPVLAVPGGGAEWARVIEAPAPKNSGVGFVLLVSLRRA